MCVLTVIASSSAGNAYALEAAGRILLIELGVEWKRIMRGIGYRVADVAGAVVSHAHSDHLLPSSLRAALLRGVPVHGPEGVEGVNPLPPKQPFAIGPFTVFPLPVPHSAPCYAYRIDPPGDCGSVLFATDCSAFPYRVRGVSHLMVEANWSPAVLQSALASGSEVRSRPEHHLSSAQAAAVALRHRPLRTALCLHLSPSNADPADVLARMRAASGCPDAAIASPGLAVPLSRYDF